MNRRRLLPLLMVAAGLAQMEDPEILFSSRGDSRGRERYNLDNSRNRNRFSKKQLEVLGSNDSKRQLREFKIKGKVVLAYSKKDAIKRINHS